MFIYLFMIIYIFIFIYIYILNNIFFLKKIPYIYTILILYYPGGAQLDTHALFLARRTRARTPRGPSVGRSLPTDARWGLSKCKLLRVRWSKYLYRIDVSFAFKGCNSGPN